MPENVRCGPINLGIAAAALLVVESTRVSNAGQHQPMPDAAGGFAILRQPRNRPNGPRNKQESVRVAEIASGQKLREKCCDGQSGEIVVRQGMDGRRDMRSALRPEERPAR